MDYTIGIIGAALILIAWVPMTARTIRERRSHADAFLELLICVGSSALALYAYLKADIVFLALNLAAATMALINLYYTPHRTHMLEEDVEELREDIKPVRHNYHHDHQDKKRAGRARKNKKRGH